MHNSPEPQTGCFVLENELPLAIGSGTSEPSGIAVEVVSC